MPEQELILMMGFCALTVVVNMAATLGTLKLYTEILKHEAQERRR